MPLVKSGFSFGMKIRYRAEAYQPRRKSPPFSCCPTPYRWMLEANFREICEDENLQIPERRNLDSSPTWVMEDNRQRTLLSHFWGKLKKRESASPSLARRLGNS
jgi:hypothetical protein